MKVVFETLDIFSQLAIELGEHAVAQKAIQCCRIGTQDEGQERGVPDCQPQADCEASKQ
jgi:hypothetical protein